MAKPSAPAKRVSLRPAPTCGPQPADAGEPTVLREFDALLARLLPKRAA
ncbi:MAG: hypothetical protein ACREF1_02185 [Acetobacteraceae bacterium]